MRTFTKCSGAHIASLSEVRMGFRHPDAINITHINNLTLKSINLNQQSTFCEEINGIQVEFYLRNQSTLKRRVLWNDPILQ